MTEGQGKSSVVSTFSKRGYKNCATENWTKGPYRPAIATERRYATREATTFGIPEFKAKEL